MSESAVRVYRVHRLFSGTYGSATLGYQLLPSVGISGTYIYGNQIGDNVQIYSPNSQQWLHFADLDAPSAAAVMRRGKAISGTHG